LISTHGIISAFAELFPPLSNPLSKVLLIKLYHLVPWLLSLYFAKLMPSWFDSNR